MGTIYKNNILYSGGGGDGGDNSLELTVDEYNALSEEEKTNGTTYYITDGVASDIEKISANNIEYDNSNSALSATNVKDAIDEVNNKLSDSLVSVSKVVTGTVFSANTATEVIVTLDNIPDGYSLIGVTGVIMGNLNLTPYGFYANTSNTVALSVRNIATNDLTANVRVYGLCAKTLLV